MQREAKSSPRFQKLIGQIQWDGSKLAGHKRCLQVGQKTKNNTLSPKLYLAGHVVCFLYTQMPQRMNSNQSGYIGGKHTVAIWNSHWQPSNLRRSGESEIVLYFYSYFLKKLFFETVFSLSLHMRCGGRWIALSWTRKSKRKQAGMKVFKSTINRRRAAAATE